MEEITTGFTSNQVLSLTFSRGTLSLNTLLQYTIQYHCLSWIRVKGVLAKIHSKFDD